MKPKVTNPTNAINAYRIKFFVISNRKQKIGANKSIVYFSRTNVLFGNISQKYSLLAVVGEKVSLGTFLYERSYAYCTVCRIRRLGFSETKNHSRKICYFEIKIFKTGHNIPSKSAELC